MGGVWSAIFTGFQQNSKTATTVDNYALNLASNGGNQFGATLMSMGFGIISGLICGLIIKNINKY